MITYLIPTAEMVASLKVGDTALNPSGDFSEVTEICFRGTTVRGEDYVGYYTKTRTGYGTVSGSYKVGELVRTVAMSAQHTSDMVDRIEKKMLADGVCRIDAPHGMPRSPT